jgi:hypothetical protein
MTAESLRDRYRGTLQVDYHDLALAEEREKYPQVLRAVEERNLRLPIVTIDGQIELERATSYWAIAGFVDRRLGRSKPKWSLRRLFSQAT